MHRNVACDQHTLLALGQEAPQRLRVALSGRLHRAPPLVVVRGAAVDRHVVCRAQLHELAHEVRAAVHVQQHVVAEHARPLLQPVARRLGRLRRHHDRPREARAQAHDDDFEQALFALLATVGYCTIVTKSIVSSVSGLSGRPGISMGTTCRAAVGARASWHARQLR